MSVAVLLITHENIAGNMLSIAKEVVKTETQNIDYIEVPMDAPLDEMKSRLQDRIDRLDTSYGIIIMTDVFGGTPCNIAKELTADLRRRLISGINLPMLIKLLNYRDLPMDELAERIVDGGRSCITMMGDE